MVPGVRVQGRVVDDAGNPVANASVQVNLGAGPTITGRVVDERGQPIRDVSLEARDPKTGHVASTGTRHDGTFTMKKRVADPGGSVFLHGAHPEFEPARSERTYTWGSTDVVLTMRDAGGLAVYVRDEDGTAITDFTVRAIKWDPNRNSSTDADVRSRGPYPSGFAAVPGIHPGSWSLLVEFPTALQRASVAMPIEKTSNDTLRVDITAHADARRTIRVVDAKNEPVAGARVQLCLQVEGPFGDETYVSPLDRLFGPWSSVRMSRALLLMEGATGADGSLVVTGPRGQPLGVRVRGPEHVPVHRGGVLLDDVTPLVITVEQGARLFGTLRPAAAFETLQRLSAEHRMELRLVSGAPNYRRLPIWFERGLPIATDGSFDYAGLEPGEWRVELEAGNGLRLGEVTLRRGESTRLDPDIGYLLTGTLRGTLHKNGAPVQGANFQIGGAAGPFAHVNTTTDAAGRFEVQVGAGAYLALLYGRDRTGESVSWRSIERATVLVGETTEQPFHVWTGELKVVVRDEAGVVVPKLRICATTSSGSRIWLPPTDAEGTTGAEVNAVPLTFSVLKLAPGSQRAQPDSVELGTATVVTGKPTIVELRLPAGWDTK
ncbi:MAG TPA: carboxypeptidase-like regulatory domain-containing protein, partial [Planctomycetota bacterium]|nr:carboxypeptidase-like regulatory domain-containing protein [Planctomycetota bacterium]